MAYIMHYVSYYINNQQIPYLLQQNKTHN